MNPPHPLFETPRTIDERFDDVSWMSQDPVHAMGCRIMALGTLATLVLGALTLFGVMSSWIPAGCAGAVVVAGLVITKLRGGAAKQKIREALSTAPATYYGAVQWSSAYAVAVFGVDPAVAQDAARILDVTRRLRGLKARPPTSPTEAMLRGRLDDERAFFSAERLPEDFAGSDVYWSVVSSKIPDDFAPDQSLLIGFLSLAGEKPELVPLPPSLQA